MARARCVWISLLTALLAAWTAVACAPATRDSTAANPELNRKFVDPELDVESWVERFEVESREVYAARHDVLRAVDARPGQRIADVGAGTGLFTRLFAEEVGPTGRVYAVDISEKFLEHIARTAAEAKLANVSTVLGRVDSITLPAASIDVAFICDTYHHFEAVQPTLESIHAALAPGGSLVLVDFERIPGRSRDWILEHVRAGKQVFREEIESAGFVFVEEVEIPGFEENYLLKFRKV